jgi:hypothetical protein
MAMRADDRQIGDGIIEPAGYCANIPIRWKKPVGVQRQNT